jgi:lipoprotein signal peptidase
LNPATPHSKTGPNEHALVQPTPSRVVAVERSAVGDPASWLRFASLGIGGVALDLWSKSWAFDTLRQNGRRVLIEHVLEFQTMLNPGALFGVGHGKTALFLVASVFALVLVGWMFVHASAKRWLLHIALGGILAGALGNMYDRVFVRLVPDNRIGNRVYLVEVGRSPQGIELQEYPPKQGAPKHIVQNIGEPIGYVRDFIKIPTRIFGKVDLWPWVFNVADMLLVGGVGILAIFLWRDRKEPERADQNEPTPITVPGDAGARSPVDAGNQST